jgi:hypothetical protein
VTTEDPTLGPAGLDALRKTSSSDVSYGIRVCIGGSYNDWLGSPAGGIAYLNSFSWATECVVPPGVVPGVMLGTASLAPQPLQCCTAPSCRRRPLNRRP